jgi:hypothetical protein
VKRGPIDRFKAVRSHVEILLADGFGLAQF